MTFTKEQVQEQRDKVEVLRYRHEDLYNKLLEASNKHYEISDKLDMEMGALSYMEQHQSES